MAQRVELQTKLENILGSPNVYFQPPVNVQIQYPCIVYSRDRATSDFADDALYRYTKRYQVTFISRDPDSSIPDQVAALPMCVFNRFYTADNLNHDVFFLHH
jgi:hypothetical protein